MSDLRLAFRSLIRSPGFMAVAVFPLALGIGANATVFSFFNALVLRPVPSAEPDRLVRIHGTDARHSTFGPLSLAEYLAYRDGARSFKNIAASGRAGELAFTVPLDQKQADPAASGSVRRVGVVFATPNYFDVLRTSFSIGGNFPPDAESNRTAPPAILSDRLWRERFAVAADIVGRPVMLNGRLFTVAGVLASEFKPVRYLEHGGVPDVWIPLSAQPLLVRNPQPLAARTDAWLDLDARLAPGVTRAAAEAELSLIAHSLDVAQPARPASHVTVLPASLLDPEDLQGGAAVMLLALLAGPALILFVACANVGNLVLARAAGRTREIAVRLALGASRWRIVRQRLAEGVLLGGLAGATALLATVWCNDLLAHFLLGPEAHTFVFAADARVLCFVAGVSFLTPLFFALIPALRASRRDVGEALKLGGGVRVAIRPRLQRLFLVLQVSLSCLLLVVSGLLARTLHLAATTDTGIDLAHLASVDLKLNEAGYDAAGAIALHRELAARIGSEPGIGYALSVHVPATGTASVMPVHVDGRDLPAGAQLPRARVNRVSPDYFSTLALPLLGGRSFAAGEGGRGTRPAVITESAARRFWPGENPVGKSYRSEIPAGPSSVEVVGVVPNTRNRAILVNEPEFYELMTADDWLDAQILVRTTGHPHPAARLIAGAARSLDPQLWPETAPLLDSVPKRLRSETRMAVLSSIVALLGLALAGSGLFALVSFFVRQRTAEIGVRIALGATPADIRRLVLGHGIGLTFVGVVCGSLLAFASSRVLEAMLFGVTPLDPATYASVAALLIAIAAGASWLPARRATRVNPIEALRAE